MPNTCLSQQGEKSYICVIALCEFSASVCAYIWHDDSKVKEILCALRIELLSITFHVYFILRHLSDTFLCVAHLTVSCSAFHRSHNQIECSGCIVKVGRQKGSCPMDCILKIRDGHRDYQLALGAMRSSLYLNQLYMSPDAHV